MGGHATSAQGEHDAIVSFVLRALQLAFSAMALVLAAGSFKSQTITVTSSSGEPISIATYLGGPTLSFVLLVTFSASLYTLLWIVFVYLRRSVVLPLDIAIGIDALLAVLLISGGCAFLASEYVRYCDLLAKSVRCGVVKTGAAFVLVSFLLFLCSVAWGAYLHLKAKKSKVMRGHHMSQTSDRGVGVGVGPIEHDDDIERAADSVDYIPTTPTL